MWNPPDDEYDEYYEDEATEPTADSREEQPSARRSFSSSSSNRVDEHYHARAGAQVVVILSRTLSVTDTNSIADEINQGHTVVVNFEETNAGEARYILAFLSGASYANHGEVRPIAAKTYIFTPAGVSLSPVRKFAMILAQNGVTF